MRTKALLCCVLSLLLMGNSSVHSEVDVKPILSKNHTNPKQNGRPYNITTSDANHFVWFRVAKVGTRTIYKILKDHNIQIAQDGYSIPFNPNSHDNYFKFAFVRNPWDRVVSCYFNKIVARCYPTFSECYGKSFEYFVDFIDRLNLSVADVHIRLQTKLIPLDQVDFVGSLENFEDDLNYVLKTIGLENVTIPKINATSRDHYSKYYTKRTANIIARKYQEDIEAFGYIFETE